MQERVQPFRYLPATETDIATMLEKIGLPSLDALFADIPDALRLKKELPIPPPTDEWTLSREMSHMAGKNRKTDDAPCFLGAGMYDHFIPAALHHITGRSEFWTSYTPYQPEMSQGMLQAIFEYQSLITGLTGMDAANASLYDGSTALVEGALLACRATRRMQLLVSEGIHPEYRSVLKDSLRHADIEIVEIPVNKENGTTDLTLLEASLTDATASILIQSPNFFGIPENIAEIVEKAHMHGAQCHVSFDPISLGLLKSPGELGADIATGEGQPLGLPMAFGGPGLGLFAVKKHLIRQMPGRIVGETRDDAGRRGFVLTLQAREQHIRREKAASNICTNQALCALTAVVYLSLLGAEGLKLAAQGCLDNTVYLQKKLFESGLAKPVFQAPFFKEFAVLPVLPPAEMNAILRKHGIIGGLDASALYPTSNDAGAGIWLLAVTEKRTKEEMDAFCRVLLADEDVQRSLLKIKEQCK